MAAPGVDAAPMTTHNAVTHPLKRMAGDFSVDKTVHSEGFAGLVYARSRGVLNRKDYQLRAWISVTLENDTNMVYDV